MSRFVEVKFDGRYVMKMVIDKKCVKDKKHRKKLKRLACEELAKALFENNAVQFTEEFDALRDDINVFFFLNTQKKRPDFVEYHE